MIKNEKTFLLKGCFFLLALCLIACWTGCSSITVSEYDKDTGKLTKETVTKNTTVATIVTSTKDKSIFMWSSGWMAWVECSPATPENPTPHFILLGGQIDKGMILLHKDQKSIDGLAAIILATRSNITITPQSISSTTTKAIGPTNSLSTPAVTAPMK